MARRSPLAAIRVGLTTVFTVTAAVFGLMVRPRTLRWGATDLDQVRPMPGDSAIWYPDVVATRAVTVKASPQEVWPWLVQTGIGRSGWYNYDWLENLFGLRTKGKHRIVPELQDLKVEDVIPLGPRQRMTIRVLEPNRSLVLHDGGPDTADATTWA